MIENRNRRIILNIVLGAIVLFIAILFWPKEEKITGENKLDRTKTQIKVKIKRINIRKEASVDSEDIGDVYKDEIYTVLSHIDKEDYFWYHIKTNDGIEGYIASNKDSEYVELISGYIDRTPPEITVEKTFLEIVNGKEKFDSVKCVDDYSKCTLTYEEKSPGFITFKATDEDQNETTKDVKYYKVFNLYKEYYQNSNDVNAKYVKTKDNAKYLISTTYTLNKIVQSKNKSYGYVPIINFYDENFKIIEDIYVTHEELLDEACINNDNFKLKKEYEDGDLLKGNTLCINYSFESNNRIKYVSFGFESIENYNNDENFLASAFSDYFILDE